jgi:hypothetical protein
MPPSPKRLPWYRLSCNLVMALRANSIENPLHG